MVTQSKRGQVFAPEVVEAFKPRLSPEHFAILMAASGTAGNYKAMGVALNIPVGTVRSRLNRARSALEGLVALDPAKQTVLGAG